ncbi:MAG: SDR family oxidoreductase [Caldilineaceae bacterium]
MILVVGATGFLGSEICRQLRAKGRPVTALVRSTSEQTKVENLTNFGTTLFYGDLKDRRSLDNACQGITTIISTASATISYQSGDSIPNVDQAGQISLIEAAKATGVSQMIYISISGNIDTECPLVTAKRGVEQHLRRSGLTYTILRPSYFMEAWLSPMVGFDFPNAKAQIYGTGQNKISWIALGDVAQFAVAALDNLAAQNTVIELGGPETVSPLAVVGIFEKLAGRPFEIQHVPEAALQTQKAATTAPLQQSFAALMLAYAKGDAIDMRATLQTFPIQLTSVREYATRVLSMA